MSETLVFPNTASDKEKLAFLSKVLNIPVDSSKVYLKQMSGGITNSVYMLKTPEKKSVVRIFGNNTDRIIDRAEEQENMKTANLIKIYATFENGMVCSFQEGRSIDVPMMSDPVISDRLAKKLGLFHRSTFFKKHGHNEVFDRIQTFIDQTNPDLTKNGVQIDMEDIKHRFTILQKEVNVLMKDRPICLTHNDLLAGNILWDGKDVGFVDYEYSGYTWPEYDIANHFLEWCGFELDLARFPSVEQQKHFLRIYLKTLFSKVPEEEEVDQWQQRVEKLVHLSHLFWGTWGYFQEANSTVKFPYFEYATWRIKLMDYHLPLNEGHELLKSQLVFLI